MTRAVLFLAAALVLLAHLRPAAAAPEADLWARWQAHDAASTARIDHAAWGRFLGKYLRIEVEGPNRVAYGAVTAADRDGLAGYLADLSATQISQFDRAEQLAFWINLYNALTVRVILDHWPVASIRDIDISPGLFSDGPWGKKLISVEGEMLSLNDVEHRILRPIWRDARIHYAVNCASIGCPDLAARPYTGEDADRMLTDAAENFVNSPRGVHIDDSGTLTASKIYDWFIADFGGDEAAVLDHLRRYAGPGLAARLEGRSGIDDHAYDWRVNAVR